jgi:glycosyltransferase involved in cell wall biosynthesis
MAILARGAGIVHLNTSLNVRAYWRDLAYLVVAKLCGARVLYQVHGGALPQQFFARSRVLTAFLRGTLQMPHAIVVLAQAELEAYRKFVPGQQVLACPNGIDYADYAKFARLRPAAAAPLKLVYVGRLVREKGLYEVLQGLKLAQEQGARARITLAGSGPEEARLRRFAEELGLAADVSFIGPAFGENKIKLLTDADVLVLASYSEGLPYALLEGMAAGAPAITTRVGAIPDVITEGVHGLFVPFRDSEAIARAIGRLAADRDLLARMSAACRRRIAGRYSMERLSGEVRRLYSEMCAGKRIKVLTRS